MAAPHAAQTIVPDNKWVGKCFSRPPCLSENPLFPLAPGQVRRTSLRRARTLFHRSCGTIRRDSSFCVTHSDSGFANRRRRPVLGSRRLSVLVHVQRPTYFSLSSRRLTVAGDQPFPLAGSPRPHQAADSSGSAREPPLFERVTSTRNTSVIKRRQFAATNHDCSIDSRTVERHQPEIVKARFAAMKTIQ